MRLKRLDLEAFGPFTGRTLVFDSGAPGLHVVFGPNEAGKSTSLRALKALLYGFPERTADNFQHANEQLLVGGCLQGSDGRELTFFRRKKRKADLLDPDGNPLEPGVLAALLQGMDPALFESLYGIDHRTLVEGGEDILAQRGKAGQALFAAGAGISSLKRVLDSLDAEADALFKARGSRQQINLAITDYKELKKIVREASIPSARWKEHNKRLQEAEDELARLEEKNRKTRAEAQRLERLNRAIPLLGDLENLRHKMQELGKVVVLPQEFQQQLREVEQGIRETGVQIAKDRARLERLTARQDELLLNRKLLEHGEAIEDLHQRLGAYRAGQRDRGRLDGMRIALRRESGARIEEIRPDLKLEDADSLRPVLGRRRTIHALVSRFEVLTQQAEQARKEKDEAQQDLDQIEKTLAELPPVRESGDLKKSVLLARRAGDIDAQTEELSREITAGKKEWWAKLKRLGLWAGELEQLPELTLPLPETVRRYEAEYDALATEKRQLKRDRGKTEAELHAALVESKEEAWAGELPSEQDLEAARRKRLQGWLILRRRWIDGEDVGQEAVAYDPERPVHEAFEQHVARADHIADRLRREAGRIARAAALQARVEGLEETIGDMARQERELEEQEARLGLAWRKEWESVHIDPLSPREMLAWLADIDTLRFRVTDILNRESEVAEKKVKRQQYRLSLMRELEVMGEKTAFPGRELAPVLVFAESVLEEIDRCRVEADRLRDRQSQVRHALERAAKMETDTTAALADWKKNWATSLAGLGLKEQVLPSEAVDLLEIIDDCLNRIKQADELQSRINGIDRDMAGFCEDVAVLLGKTALPELTGLPPDQAVLQLSSLLDTNRRHNSLRQKNSEEVEALTLEIEKGEKILYSLHKRLAGLLAAAGCGRIENLPEAIRRSGEYQGLQEKISAAESSLAQMSDGLPLKELKRQAQDTNVDELPAMIAALHRLTSEELEPRITEIYKLIGEERGELRRTDGNARAAEAAEKMEGIAARIRRLADQYTRLRLAAMLLKNEIERYREEHQDPVLRIASGYFAKLTLHSFAGLRTDIDDAGNPVLVGVRADKSRLGVAAMSAGTRDQLYLALRLATLEWRLANSEPLPFIVDDILINFDDARARATLEALADLGEKNQVILFTHHRRIVDDAHELMTERPVFVHEL
ncbi:MAG TPA: hypothetical protein ENN06_11930 [Desulfobacteraceae bacterium]|nr:hypothetical protein [Desulfobacteraceae bacterium]